MCGVRELYAKGTGPASGKINVEGMVRRRKASSMGNAQPVVA